MSELCSDRQRAVVQLGLRALATDDVQPLMDEAVELVARILEVDSVAIVEVPPTGAQLVLRAGTGWQEGSVGVATAFPGRRSLVGYTLLVAEPVVSEDVLSDERFSVSGLLASHGVVSAASVVMAGREEPIGVLGAFSTHRRAFSQADVDVLQGVATILAMTVARIDAEDDLIVVRETERHRIARDLHEEALQDLTEALDKAIANEPAETLVPALERVGEQLRVAIYDLRLGGEQGRPFGERLRSMVRVHRVIAGDCRVELHVADGVPAGPLGAVGTEVLRILAEALNNARRHAGARHVEVRVSATETDLRAEVSDDGRGFDPGVAATGIRGMHERAQLIEGRLDLRSEPGAGTRVRVEVPLPEREGPGRDVRIVLVEDHAAVREAIASAFEREAGFRVVGQAGTLRDARRMLADVDVVILDLRLPDGDGAELIKDLQDVNPQAQAVVLTAALDRVEIARAVRYGAAGAINKTAHLDEVIDAVRRLHAGQTLLPPDEVIALLRLAERHTRAEDAERRTAETLTLRERQVLQALAEGLDTQAVAGHLHISVRTVRNHAANILTKLGVHSQLQAVLFAVRNDVVDIGTTRGDRG